MAEVAYAGPFTLSFREQLQRAWTQKVAGSG